MPAEKVYAAPGLGVATAGPPGARGWRDRLFAALLPAACLGCGAPLPASPAASALGLCAACRGRLRAPGNACGRCALPLAASTPAGFLCGRCRAHPPAYDRLLALWSYEPPLDAVVRGLKFGRLDYLGRHLGVALAEAFLAELGPDAEAAGVAGIDRVVPVPLHWRRRLARGFNQAERIARPLAAALGRPLAQALVRRRATPPQSGLGRPERLANPRRAFRVRRGAGDLAGATILLVDDVATTGATLDGAALTLKRAGAGRVIALVAGRTPGR